MRYYPVGLNLVRKRVVIIGGGRIAERKAKILLSFGASVKIVAPDLTQGISKLARGNKISAVKKRYVMGDLKGASLVIAATYDRSLNRKIGRDASRKGIWANVVDDTAACDFISTAVIRKHGLVIAISTGGKNPRLSKAFKGFLRGKLNEFNFNRDKS